MKGLDPILDGVLKDIIFHLLGDRNECEFEAREHPTAVREIRRKLDLPVSPQRGSSGHFRVREAPKSMMVSVTFMPLGDKEKVRIRRYG